MERAGHTSMVSYTAMVCASAPTVLFSRELKNSTSDCVCTDSLISIALKSPRRITRKGSSHMLRHRLLRICN